MSPHRHLSPLELDEVASGLSAPPDDLERCTTCRARLDELRASAAALLDSPPARRQLARLTERVVPADRARTSGARWMRRTVAVAAAIAAGLVIAFALPSRGPVPTTRLKGQATVMLLDASDRPLTQATPGQRLTLAVGGAGYAYGAVFAVDAQGHSETLWPEGGSTLALLPGGASARLAEFEVTPGDVTVKAVFADSPQPLSSAGDEVATVTLKVH
jgi:hypothetical protein